MLLTLFFSFLLIFLGIILITYILSVIGLWGMFQKTDRPGWHALIPIYNTYILCIITGVSPWWLALSIISDLVAGLVPILSILASVISIYFGVLLAVSVARSFGKEDIYAIGIYFLPFIFYMIIGLGDSKYLGARPMDDIVFHHFSSENMYCSSCGAKVDLQAKYCPKCGKEL